MENEDRYTDTQTDIHVHVNNYYLKVIIIGRYIHFYKFGNSVHITGIEICAGYT